MTSSPPVNDSNKGQGQGRRVTCTESTRSQCVDKDGGQFGVGEGQPEKGGGRGDQDNAVYHDVFQETLSSHLDDTTAGRREIRGGC